MATFSEFLQQLTESVSSDSFNSSNLKDLDVSRDDYWKEILEYMKTTSLPLLESEFGSGSVFDYIQKNADLNDSILTNLLNKIVEGGVLNNIDLTTESGLKSSKKDYFWNESVSKALAYFTRYFYPSVQNEIEDTGFVEGDMTVSVLNGSIPVNGEVENFRIKDVKKADAGRSFSSNGKWVSPWYNINANTYKKVRGNDVINSVITSSKELQFTRNPASGSGDETNFQWIRLIMPKYLRNVEVEDLNRNFWVTAQVLTAISAYLFADDNPITEMFKKLLNEIVQLWENILYLWLAMAILSQDQYYTDIHTEVLYLPNDSLRNFTKFDNFTNNGFTLSSTMDKAATTTLLQNIWKNLSYLKDTYSTSNLCIIPCIRDNNYQKNYYSKEYYPGIITYNRNKNSLKYIPFLLDNKILVVDSEDSTITSAIGTIKENDYEYSYIVPYKLVNTVVDQEVDRYYSLIRTVPNITATFIQSSNIIEFTSFVISLYDVATIVAKGNEDKFLTFTSAAGNENSESLNVTKSKLLNNKTNKTTATRESNIAITKGYYQGELISNYKNNGVPPNYNIITTTYDGIPVEGKIETVYNTIENYQSDDDKLLSLLSGRSSYYFTLYTILHSCGFWTDKEYEKKNGQYINAEGEVYQPTPYYKINGDSYTRDTLIFEEVENGKTYVKNKHSDSFKSSAFVWNPITQSLINYPKYQWYSIHPGPILSYKPGTKITTASDYTYTSIYKKDKYFTKDNWCIKYIEMRGGWSIPTDTTENKIPANQFTYEKDFSSVVNGTTMRLATTRIYIHLFNNNGQYERKILNRFKMSGTELLDWYIEEKTKGFDNLYNSLTNATLFAESSPLHFDIYPKNGRDA